MVDPDTVGTLEQESETRIVISPNLDWTSLLERIQAFATSLRGKTQLGRTSPLSGPAAAAAKMQEITEAREILASGVRPFMESLDAFSGWWERLRKNAVLKTLELRDVRKFCHEALALKEATQDHESNWCRALREQLMEAERPLSAIDSLMSPQGEIRTDASPRLHALTQEKSQLARQIQSQLDKLVKSFDLETVLQDRFVTTREGRWVLPVKSGAQHQFSGIIHSASHSKQTVFMETEVVIPLNNRLSQVETEIEEEIERLLIEISTFLSSLVTEFKASAQLLEEADCRFAEAQMASQMNAEAISFNDHQLSLMGLKHPLLVLSERHVVENDVELTSENRILLLSGPNAGGKTVLLKSVGLAAHMARCGLPVCADAGSSLPFFREILTAVGDSQSVESHLSTFAAHVSQLNSALQYRGPQNLILIDEICGSTDPEEGAALARSFIEAYGRNGALGVITSHLGPLKQGWSPEVGVRSGSMEYDSRSGRPTYRFLTGVPGNSLALKTAEKVGVAEGILARARECLSPETRDRIAHAQEIEALKTSLTQLQEELRTKQRVVEALKADLEKRILDFEETKQDKLNQLLHQTERRVAEVIEQGRVQNIFRKHELMNQVQAEFPKIVKPSRRPDIASLRSADDFSRAFPPGTTVYVPSLNADGIVQGTPNAKGEIPILSQSLRLIVPWTELKPPERPGNPTQKLLRKAAVAVTAGDDFEASVDLRGLRLDEAVERLEVTLDQALLRGQDRVKIVHGHGTEALKKGVRQHLSRSPAVKSWQAGPDDGITWALL